MYLPFRLALSVAAVLIVATLAGSVSFAADDATAKKYEQMIDKAVAFLGTKAQADDGSYNAAAGPAVTALVTTGVLQHGRSPEDPLVAKALKYLEGFVREDG